MRRMYWLSVLMVLAWLGCAANSRADTIMFTDRDAWEAAVVALGYSTTNIDFEDTTTSGGFTNSTVTAGDVTFSSLYAPLEVVESPAAYDSGMVLYPTHNQSVEVTLPSGVYAFGFDLGEIYHLANTSAATLGDVVLSTGDSFAGPYYGNPYPTYGFFGFVSDAPVTSVSMHPHATVEPILDNFTYAQEATPVPEPSSMLLLCSGLLGLAGHSWRNRRRR